MAADRLRARLEDELDRAATSAFSRAFLAAALLAMLAAAAVVVAIALDRGRAARVGVARAPGTSNGSHRGPQPSLNVAGPAAAVVATALVAAYVALGGATYGPTPVADPCEPRTRPAGVGRTQLTLLAALDGGACRLRLHRETFPLSLLDGKRPPGVTDDRLSGALEAGVDRAQREGAINGLVALSLKLALKTGGPLALVKRLIE